VIRSSGDRPRYCQAHPWRSIPGTRSLPRQALWQPNNPNRCEATTRRELDRGECIVGPFSPGKGLAYSWWSTSLAISGNACPLPTGPFLPWRVVHTLRPLRQGRQKHGDHASDGNLGAVATRELVEPIHNTGVWARIGSFLRCRATSSASPCAVSYRRVRSFSRHFITMQSRSPRISLRSASRWYVVLAPRRDARAHASQPGRRPRWVGLAMIRSISAYPAPPARMPQRGSYPSATRTAAPPESKYRCVCLHRARSSGCSGLMYAGVPIMWA